MTLEYTLKARLAPTALAAPPLLLLCDSVFDVQANQWIQSNTMVLLFGQGAATAALVFLMIQVNRLIGLEIFQRWLSKDELNFPTTRMLLPNNLEMSASHRSSINKKLLHDFQVGLLPNEMGDTEQVRRHNADLVGRVRIFVGSPQKLLQHNIEYGFFRNLIGASVPVVIVGLVSAFLYSENLLSQWIYQVALAYAFIAGALICFSRRLMNRLGLHYARVLFQTYLEKSN